jgi:hypothetical protein
MKTNYLFNMTNDLYRVRAKLAVLETHGLKWFIADLLEEVGFSNHMQYGPEDIENLIRKIRWEYIEEKVKLEQQHGTSYKQLSIED